MSRSVSLRRRVLHSSAALALAVVGAGWLGVVPARTQDPVAQDPVATARLQQEADALRATIDELRAELARLKRELGDVAQGEAAQAGAQARLDGLAAESVGSLEQLLAAPQARPAQEAADDPRPALLGPPRLVGGGVLYVVQPGDTLASISTRLFGSARHYQDLLRLNPEIEPQKLRPGQHLRVGWGNSGAAAAGGGAGGERTRGDASGAGTRDQANDAIGLGSGAGGEAGADDRIGPRLQAAGHGPAVATDGSLAELVDVVTRCIELQGDVEIAEVELAQAAKRSERGVASDHELRLAEIRLRTRQQQLDAVRGILKAEHADAEREVARLRALSEQGRVPSGPLRRAESRLEVLRRAL